MNLSTTPITPIKITHREAKRKCAFDDAEHHAKRPKTHAQLLIARELFPTNSIAPVARDPQG